MLQKMQWRFTLLIVIFCGGPGLNQKIPGV
jgi:hypothetical protein